MNPLAARALSDLRRRTLYLDTMEQAARVAAAPPDGSVEGSADTPAQGGMEREIRKIYAQIQEGAHADGGKLVTNERFDQEVGWLIEFAQNRPGHILDQVRRERER